MTTAGKRQQTRQQRIAVVVLTFMVTFLHGLSLGSPSVLAMQSRLLIKGTPPGDPPL
jgi:hypothetical protein